jgi:hypothetical protein
MSERGSMGVERLEIGDEGAWISAGAQTTRDTVRAEVDGGPATGGIGSLYLSTAGKVYVKVAAADATADWEKVTTTAAD